MTAVEAAAYRAGIEAAARECEARCTLGDFHRTAVLEAAAAAIRALPVPSGGEPDFGTLTAVHQGVVLECKAAAPGLSLHDLVVAFETAKNQAAPDDHLSANPSKWPTVRGVTAVRNAIVNAIYSAAREQP